MFFSRRGERIADVMVPTTWPSALTGHLELLNWMPSPPISTPTSFRVAPAALIRRKASRPMNGSALSSSTSHPRPTS